MSEHNITVEGGSSVRLKTAGKYCDRDIVVTSTGGVEDLDSVLTEQETLIATLQDTLRSKAAGGESLPVAKALIRNGIGHIDTGVDAANNNLKIEIRYEFLTMPTGYFYVIRAYDNETTNTTRILHNKNMAVYSCLNSIPSKSLTYSETKYANVVYTDILKPESSTTFSYTTDGTKVTASRTSGDELIGKNILLFNDSTSSDDDVVIKVYYLKIYDGETLVRDYVPFVTKSGECGLYDLITNQFYGNAGEGTFDVEMSSGNLPEGGGGTSTPTQEKTVSITANGSVEITPDDGYTLSKVVANVNVPTGGGVLPIGYTLVPSIKFTGEQAIDTGIICNQDTQLRAVFIVDEYKTMYIYGVASVDNTASITAYRSGDAGRWRFGDQYIALNTDADEKIVWCVNTNKQRIQRGNVESNFGKVNNFTTEGTLVFGAGRLADGSIEEATRFVGRIAAFELYDGEELIRSFVPCKNADGVCGFWDIVSEQFFVSATDTPLLEWSFL